MATGGPVYRTTKETENFERLCRAFVDLSTDVYRDILRYYMFVEPSELWNEVNACPDLKNKLPLNEQNKLNYSVHNCTISNLDLSFLYKLIRSISEQNLRLDLDKNIQAFNIWTKVQADRVLLSTLSRMQEDKVKRASRIGNYSECDCLLLSTLLDSQCPGYQLPALVPTSNRWGANPARPADVKLGDDIERIRNLRNSRYGHVSDTCIPDPDFKTIWTELTEIMSRMDKELQTGGYYSAALAELERTNLDGRWEKYETRIKELNKNVKLVQIELHKQKKVQERTTHRVAALSCEQKELVKKHEDITQHVATLNSEQKDLMEKHEDFTQQVATLSSEQKDLVEKHEDITQQVATLNQKQKDTADLEQMIKTQIASHDTNAAELSKVQNLLENIITAKQLWDESKQIFEDIKKEQWTEKAENKLRQLERKEDRWDRSIECAVKLEKELQDSRSNDTFPYVLEKELQRIQQSEDFNYLQYLHDAEKSDHEHNIHGLIDTAVKEIRLKKEEISPGLLTSWNKDDETFSPTKATEYIYKEAQTKHKILLDGLPGSGKSANVHHIALRLKNKGYKLFCMRSVNEMVEMIDKLGEDKQVYVFDDVFGVHGVVEEKRRGWGDENKDCLERCLKKSNVIILCTSRSTVIKDDQLSNIKSRFTIINISQGENELSDDERVEIFRRHAAAKQRDDLLKDENQLTDKVKDKIKNITCPVGCFPLVCRLYTGDKEIKQTIEEYFNKPLKVIADNLAKLRIEEPIRHFCLLLCLIYDNKLPVNKIEVAYESEQDEQTKLLRQQLLGICELEPSPSLQTIKNKMDTLLETFVKLEGSHYIFVHDIIHDAVIKHVSGLSSSVHKVIMRHCSSKFMRYRVHLSGVVCKDWRGRGHNTESCINIRPDSFTCWGERVLDIVRDGVRTSDQLYNDIDEGRCSIYDDRVRWDNPWRDVFVYNRCVHSTEGQTAIVQALKSSDVQMIMCTKGYSWYGGPRVTGLHWAMYKGLTHIVTQTMSMLSTTQLREVESIHGGGLVCSAIRGRCGTDVIQALIVGGADVNTPDGYGRTPLCLAIDRLCGTDVIQALIVGGADVNTPDVYGRTPLCSAIDRRCGTDVIQALIVGGANVNTPVRGETPLCSAIDGECGTDVIQALIVGGADVNTPDVYGRTPLCSAIDRRCGTDVIQALIVGGANVNTPVRGETPLCSAIDRGCGTDVIQALIVGGADVNTPVVDGRTPLCSAIRERCGTDVIQALIVGGVDVNTPDVFGRIPLYESVLDGDYEITQLLVDKGADVNQCDWRGTSVLYKSQLEGYGTITELLQSRGAVCIYKGKRYNHVTDIPGKALLHFVLYNNYQAVKILIERGDDVNRCDEDDKSVLCQSQLYGRDTITELLQSRGAVCIYKGKRYTTITDIPDSEVDRWERWRIQKLKEKQNVTI